MDSLKKMLGREIPFEKAAAYFVGLKRPAIEAEDAPVLEEAAQKLAAAEESVEQQISRLSPLQRAQLGAAYSVMGAREEDQPGVAAPALGGAGGGAAAGGALGAGLGALARVATRGRVKLPTRQAAGAGAALGALAGGHQGFGVGQERKQEYQGETQQLARGALSAVPEMAQLSAQHGGAPVELRDGNRSYGTVRGVPTQHGIMPIFSPKTAALLSKLAEGAPPMEVAQEVPMASPSPLAAPDVQSYMEQEMMGSRQEMEAALGFYQQKLEEARAQTEEATRQAQQAMQLAEQLQAQQAQSAMQQQQLQQQAVEAGNRSLEAKANESQMTMQLQALREQLLTLATNVGAPLGGPQPGDPQPEPQVGPDGQPVSAEGAPPGQEQAAGGAPPEQGSQPPGGEGGEGGAGGQASSPAGGGQKPGGVTVKVSSVGKVVKRTGELLSGSRAKDYSQRANLLGWRATARAYEGKNSGPALKAMRKAENLADKETLRVGAARIGAGVGAAGAAGAAAGLVASKGRKKEASIGQLIRRPEMAGAAIGGTLGLGAGAAEAAGAGPDLDALRGRIAENEAGSKEPGIGGFRKALDLAKDRALLTLGEAAQDHPVMSTLAGGAIGAAAGYRMGPQFAGKINEAKRLHGR